MCHGTFKRQSSRYPVIEPALVQLVIVVGYSTRGLGAFPVHWEFAHLIHAFYEVGGISIDFVESLGAGPGTAVRHTRVASSQIVQNLAIAEFQQFRQLEAKKCI